jgi:hypothetical protein
MKPYYILAILFIGCVSCKEQDRDEKGFNTENPKCTELKNKVEADILLNVPCVFLRVMEHFKASCPLIELKNTFLG